MTIELDYLFQSLHEQTKGYLLAVKAVDKSKLTDEQIDVFTRLNVCTHYILNEDKYILLVLLGEKLIPYAVLVPYTEKDFNLYTTHKFCVYDIHIKNPESKQLNLRRRK